MHFVELLAALGAVQGVLLLVLISLRFRHHKNVPFALLLLVYSLRLGTIPSWNPLALLAHPWLLPATAPLPFLFGPLLWWYVRELTTEGNATPRRLPLHFLPYLLETVLVVTTVVGMSAGEYAAFVREVFAGNPPAWMPVRNALKVGVNLAYLVLAVRMAFRFGAPTSTVRAAAGVALGATLRHRRLWVRAVSVVPIASLIPFAFVAVYPLASARLAAGEALPFTILAAAMAGLIYTFSILILLAPDVPALGCSDTVRYAEATRSGLPCHDEQSLWIAEKLRSKLIAGAYRDPEVSLHSLATELHVTPNRLSLVVNHIYGQTFRELVNRCRIDYFIRRVLNHALDEQCILNLAFEAGFSSKSTFNRVFKEHIGMSPSCYAAGVETRGCGEVGAAFKN